MRSRARASTLPAPMSGIEVTARAIPNPVAVGGAIVSGSYCAQRRSAVELEIVNVSPATRAREQLRGLTAGRELNLEVVHAYTDSKDAWQTEYRFTGA